MERTIGYDEARQFLASRTVISSTFGRALERMEYGHGMDGYDPVYQQGREEARRLYLAPLFRCIEGLANRDAVRFCYCPDLRAFAKRARREDTGQLGMGEGEAAVRILCAYEQWDPKWPEKGLADAYQWMRSRVQELLPIALENGSAAQAFRVGKAPQARRYAASVVADCHVILAEWVRIWNGQNGKKRRAAA